MSAIRTLHVLLVATITASLGVTAGSAAETESPDSSQQVSLTARATLAADTFAPGPASGAAVEPKNGQTPPFPGQPVGGVSALLTAEPGSYWAMPDNGFGNQANSADFLLRMYHFTPRFATAEDGAGSIDVGEFISLRDPAGRAGFPIVNEGTTERLLTGADFDIESVQRGSDGTLWFGDEFGPFLLHTSADGELLTPPIAMPGVQSPENPDLPEGQSPTLLASRGFEALGADADGTMLYPILERPVVAETDPLRRVIYEFDTRSGEYTGRTWQYRADAAGNSISDAQLLPDGRFAVLERDSAQREQAVGKRIYAVDLGVADDAGFLVKEQLADLLAIANPELIGGDSSGGFGLGDPFSMPFPTVEALLILDDGKILAAQDNNYPDNDVRVTGVPDATELIIIGTGTP